MPNLGNAGDDFRGISVRRLADTSKGERVEKFDPDTGAKVLINPDTGQVEPWPTLGWEIEGDLPMKLMLPIQFVERGISDGWITVENPRVVVRPGGPPNDPWKVDPARRIPHTFRHVDSITLNCLSGSYTFNVIQNPDKWHSQEPGTDVAGDTNAQIRNYYLAELVS